ncbi:MAG: L-threonylcarbamoyladenylate synthase [Microbacter sp.]
MEEDLKKCIEVLRSGGVILYPTDTVWGLGCDAGNEKAVQRIFELKKRADNKALLLLVDSFGRLQSYVESIPDLAFDLIEMSEKPLTIIYSQGKNLAANVLADDGSIGIRITKEPFSHALCERFRRPIVSTSANTSGQPTPRNFLEIEPYIVESVDYVVKYRQNDATPAKASSIIKLGPKSYVKIIRE